MSLTAQATTYYWDTTTTGAWNTGADWSTTSTTGGTTGVVPTSADSAVFDQSTVNGAETVSLSQAQSITGITFNNTGTTLLESSSSTPQTLTLGTGGITVASTAGAVTIGDPTDILNLALGGSQSWTNNSTANTFTVVNGITNTANTTPYTLTLAGAGNFALQSAITNGGSTGTIALTQSGSGSSTLSGANTYTGTTSITGGTLVYKGAAAMSSNSSISTSSGVTLSLLSDTDATFTAAGFGPSGGVAVTLNVGPVSTGSSNSLTFSPTAATAVGGASGATMTFNVTGSSGDRLILSGGDLQFTNVASSTLTLDPTTANLTVSKNIDQPISGKAGVLTLDGTSASNLFSGNITNGSGTVSVTKSNSSTWALSGANTYSGTTSITGGTLVYNGASSMSSNSSLSPSNGVTLSLLSDTNATFTAAGFGPAGGATVTLNVGPVSTGSGNSLTLSSSAVTPVGSTNMAFNVTGSSGDSLILSGGDLQFTSGSSQSLTLNPTTANLTVSKNINEPTSGKPGLLTLNGTSANNLFSGNITNGSGTVSVTKSNTSTWALSGTNTYSGTTSISGGTLVYQGASAMSSNSSISPSTGVTLSLLSDTNATFTAAGFGPSGGATVTLNVGPISTGSGNSLTLSSSPVTFVGSTTMTFDVTGSSGDSLIFSGGDLNFTGGTGQGLVLNPTTANLTVSKNISDPNSGGTALLTLNGTSTGNLFSGNITNGGGTVSVTKSNSSTWTLSGSNSYTGTTTLSAGTLLLGSGGSLANTAVSVASGATLSPAAGTSIGNTATSAAGATLNLNSGGTLNLADGTIGNFTISQGGNATGTVLTLAGGTLKFDLGASTSAALSSSDRIIVTGGNGSVAASNSNTITLNTSAASSLFAGATYQLITATSGLGTSNYVISNPNVVVGGSLYNLSLAGSTGTTELLTVGSGATAATAAYWAGGQSSSWATTNSGTTYLTNFVTDATGATNTYATPTSGTNVTFTATSAGNLSTTLDQAFTINSLSFTGNGTSNTAGTTIAAGTGAAASTLTINAAAVNGNTLGNGITVASGSGANTISANVVLGGNQTWTNNSANTLTVSGAVSGAFNLTEAGAGTLVLSASNGYSGATTVSGGTLALSGSGTLGNGTAPLTLAGGTVDLGTTSQTVGAVSITTAAASGNTIQNGNLTGTSYAASNTSGNAIVTANLLANGSAGLTKSGAGTLTLSGANIYTGTTTVSTGTLVLSGSNSSSGATTVSGGTLQLANTASDGGLASGTLSLSGGTLQATVAVPSITNAVSLTANSTISGSQALTLAGVFTNSGANSTLTVNNSAATAITGGNVYLSEATGTGRTLTINGSGAVTIGDAIANYNGGSGTASSLTYSGSGTLTLSGNNSYTGNTSVTTGILVLSGSDNNGASATTTVNNLATLQLQANNSNTSNFNGSPSTALGTASGKLALNDGSTLQLRSNTSVTFSGTDALGGLNGRTITIDVNNITAGTGNGATNAGTQTQTLSLATGTTFVGTTGQFNITGGDGYTLAFGPLATGNGTGNTETFNPTTASVTIASYNNGVGASNTLALAGTSTGNAVLGAITNSTGALAVTKSGASTWTLSASNSYSGGTTINAGTLRTAVSGAINTTGALSIAGGTLVLGTDSSHVGSLTTGAETWTTGGYSPKILNAGAPTSGSGDSVDNISMSTLTDSGLSNFAITLTAPSSSSTTNFIPSDNYVWQIANFTGAVGSTIPANTVLATAGSSGASTSSGLFTLDTSSFVTANNSNGNTIPSSGNFFLELEGVSGSQTLDIGYNATPEPGTAMLVLAGALRCCPLVAAVVSRGAANEIAEPAGKNPLLGHQFGICRLNAHAAGGDVRRRNSDPSQQIQPDGSAGGSRDASIVAWASCPWPRYSVALAGTPANQARAQRSSPARMAEDRCARACSMGVPIDVAEYRNHGQDAHATWEYRNHGQDAHATWEYRNHGQDAHATWEYRDHGQDAHATNAAALPLHV